MASSAARSVDYGPCATLNLKGACNTCYILYVHGRLVLRGGTHVEQAVRGAYMQEWNFGDMSGNRTSNHRRGMTRMSGGR